MRNRAITVALLFGALVIARGCRTPTEVTVTLRTDAPCASLSVVEITVGPDPGTTETRVASSFVTASTHQCAAGGLIGTLVVTPAGSSAAIAVTAQLGHEACVPPLYKNCIVARR